MLPRPGHYEWVNPTFELACAASAGVDLSATNVSVDPRGLQNLVILAPGRAYRFPRREAGAAALVEAAERLRIAAAAGVPTAQVLAVVEGAVGTAHLVLSPVAGCGLDEIDAGLLPAGFSAEHLGPNDYYYWDDFWGLAGLIAAARLALRAFQEIKSEKQKRRRHRFHSR